MSLLIGTRARSPTSDTIGLLFAKVLCDAPTLETRIDLPSNFLLHSRIDPSIELGAVPDVLSGSWSWCLVILKVVPQPQPDDWIGVFTVNRDETTINATRHAPVKFKVIYTAPNHI